MDQVAHLSENAGECRRLASQAADDLAVRVLMATAEGYEREADAAKREQAPADVPAAQYGSSRPAG